MLPVPPQLPAQTSALFLWQRLSDRFVWLPLQVQGNDSLKRGLQLRKKFYLRQAQEQYSQGLAVQCGDSAVDGVLYSNRAQV